MLGSISLIVCLTVELRWCAEMVGRAFFLEAACRGPWARRVLAQGEQQRFRFSGSLHFAALRENLLRFWVRFSDE